MKSIIYLVFLSTALSVSIVTGNIIDFAVVEIHLNLNDSGWLTNEGSYLKVKLEPLSGGNLTIKLSGLDYDSTQIHRNLVKLDGIYKYSFPTVIPPDNPMNITATLTTSTGKKECNYLVDWSEDHSHANNTAPPNMLYHPLNRMTKYSSLRRLSDEGAYGGHYSNVWNSNDGQHWTIDRTNPEQINVTSLTNTTVQLKCFICKHIKAHEVFGNYTLYLYTGDAVEPAAKLPLMNKTVDDSGFFTVTLPANTILDITNTRVKLIFNYYDESLTSFEQLYKTTDPPTDFINKQETFVRRDFYLNEVHIPTKRDQTKESDKFWIELIQDTKVQRKLDDYYLMFIHMDTTLQKLIFELSLEDTDQKSSLQRFSSEQATSEYFIWKNMSADAKNVINGMAAVRNMSMNQQSKINVVVLLKRQSDKWYIQDYVRFDWTAYMRTGCNTNAWAPFDRPCQQIPSECLLLSSNVTTYTAAHSFSRCGLEKEVNDPFKMWYWRVENSTEKSWNVCPKPCAHFKSVNFPNSTITFASRQETIPHLTTSGLEVTLLQLRVKSTGGWQIKLIDWDANLRFATNSAAKVINVTIHSADQKLVNSEQEVQVEGKLLSITQNSIYVITLSHHYSFLNITLDDVRNKLVDVFIFGRSLYEEAAINLMANFTQANELSDLLTHDIGYFILNRVDPVYFLDEQLVAGLKTSAWKVKTIYSDETFTPDTVYFMNILRSYIRINRISSTEQFTLSLAKIPESIKNQPLLKNGVLIDNIQIYAVKNNTNISNPLVTLHGHQYIKFDKPRLITDLPGDGASSSWFTHKATTVFLWQGTTDQAKSQTLPLTPGKNVEAKLIDSLILQPTDINQKDHLRCFSDEPNHSLAFQSVDPGQPCSPPGNIIIYKVCYDRVGLMVTNRRETPTDKLYLYQLDDQKKVIGSVIAIGERIHLLTDTHSIISINLNNSLPYTAVILTFSDQPPVFRDHLPLGAVDMAVWYNDNGKHVNDYKSSIMEDVTSDGQLSSNRDPIMLKTDLLDKRRCILSCNYAEPYTIIYSAGRRRTSPPDSKYVFSDLRNGKDLFCTQVESDGAVDQFTQVRINEINVDSQGLHDREEFIELIAPKDFNMLFGFQILIIAPVAKNEVQIKKLVQIDSENKFVNMNNVPDKSMLVISHKEETDGNQKFAHLKFIHPNELGAILLVWGIDCFNIDEQFIIDLNAEPIFRLNNFIIDMIAYKQSDKTTQKNLRFNQFIERILPNNAGNTPVIEPPDSKNDSFSISRCFCSDRNSFSCFELSTSTSLGQNNTCPNLYRRTIKFCKKSKSLGREYVIEQLQLAVNKRYALSIYQIQILVNCTSVLSKDTDKKFIVSVTIGFPEKEHLRILDTLDFINDTFTACGNGDVCLVEPVSTAAPIHHAGMIVGVVMGILCLLIIAIISAVCILRRVKKKRDMSAHFETCNDDDDEDSFIPTGRISFSNPWYNQNHSNGNTYSQLKT